MTPIFPRNKNHRTLQQTLPGLILYKSGLATRTFHSSPKSIRHSLFAELQREQLWPYLFTQHSLSRSKKVMNRLLLISAFRRIGLTHCMWPLNSKKGVTGKWRLPSYGLAFYKFNSDGFMEDILLCFNLRLSGGYSNLTISKDLGMTELLIAALNNVL